MRVGTAGHPAVPETGLGVQGNAGALTGSGSKAPRWGDLWVEPAETHLEAQVVGAVRRPLHCQARQRQKKGWGPAVAPRRQQWEKGAGGMRLGRLPPAVNSVPQTKPKGNIDWKCSSFLFALD